MMNNIILEDSDGGRTEKWTKSTGRGFEKGAFCTTKTISNLYNFRDPRGYGYCEWLVCSSMYG